MRTTSYLVISSNATSPRTSSSTALTLTQSFRVDSTVVTSRCRYLEFGELDGSFYGTKFDSVRQVIRSEKMCILDISPQVRFTTAGDLLFCSE